MAKHKRQHYIPSSYLEAWCDPNTPSGQTPYVWRFSKDGLQAHKKSPQKIFYETDMYTVLTADGKRDLRLEYNLSKLEGDFSKLRARTLKKNKSLTPKERMVLCRFVAAMFARTKAYAKHQSSEWQHVLDLGKEVQSAMENATPENRKQMQAALSSPHNEKQQSISMDQVREIIEKPIQATLTANVVQTGTLLYKKPFLVLETLDSTGFITSDDPCVWYDPAIFQKPKPFGAGGLISPTLEITLPLSPNQMLFFGGELMFPNFYLPINNAMVDNLNIRTRLFSDEFFISNNQVVNPSWL